MFTLAILTATVLLINGTLAKDAHYENKKNLRNEIATADSDVGQVSEIAKRHPLHLDPIVVGMGPKFWISSGECPQTSDGVREHFCPSPTPSGKWICVDDYQLCDGVKNCPHAEDESSIHCLFFRIIRYQISLLAKGIDFIDESIKRTTKPS